MSRSSASPPPTETLPSSAAADLQPPLKGVVYNKPGPFRRTLATSKPVKEFLADKVRRLGNFINAREDDILPVWRPSRTEYEDWKAGHDGSKILEHLKTLQVPSLRDKPNILLHRLGDEELSRRAMQTLGISTETPADTIFINTSGSGKTRTLLDYLSANWGLYFVCQVDSGAGAIGSKDLVTILERQLTKDFTKGAFKPELPSEDFDDDLERNQNIAGRYFSQAMLARLIILRVFLMMAEQSGMNEADCRKRWLLLQLCPHLLEKTRSPGENFCDDIFLGLQSTLDSADFLNETHVDTSNTTNMGYSLENLRSNIAKIHTTIQNAISMDREGPKQRLCVVVDEVQKMTYALSSAFYAHDKETHRPAVRELLSAWTTPPPTFDPYFILSGTGIESGVVKEAIHSVVAKPGLNRVCSLGSFSGEDVESYLKEYIPSFLQSMDEWKQLVHRCKNWLVGRYRFSAILAQLLLLHGFQDPHIVLAAYIYVFTDGFTPFDASNLDGSWVPSAEIPLRIIRNVRSAVKAINFDLILGARLLDSQDIIDSMMKISYKRFLSYKDKPDPIDSDIGSNHALWVEAGLARYSTSEKDVVYDEPLAHLVFDQWIRSRTNCTTRSLWYCVHDHMRWHSKYYGDGWENILASYLAHVFSSWFPLGKVFNILGEEEDEELRELGKKDARLVTYYRDFKGNLYHSPVSVRVYGQGKSSSPTHVLGYRPKKDEAVLNWLTQNEEKSDQESRQGSTSNHRDSEHLFLAPPAPFCFPTESMGPDLLFFLEIRDIGVIRVAVQAKAINADEEKNTDTLGKAETMDFLASITPANYFATPSRGPNKMTELTLNALSTLHDGYEGEMDIPYKLLRALGVFPQATDMSFRPDKYKMAQPVRPDAEKSSRNADQWKAYNIANYRYMAKVSANPCGSLDHMTLVSVTSAWHPENKLARVLVNSLKREDRSAAEEDIREAKRQRRVEAQAGNTTMAGTPATPTTLASAEVTNEGMARISMQPASTSNRHTSAGQPTTYATEPSYGRPSTENQLGVVRVQNSQPFGRLQPSTAPSTNDQRVQDRSSSVGATRRSQRMSKGLRGAVEAEAMDVDQSPSTFPRAPRSRDEASGQVKRSFADNKRQQSTSDQSRASSVPRQAPATSISRVPKPRVQSFASTAQPDNVAPASRRPPGGAKPPRNDERHDQVTFQAPGTSRNAANRRSSESSPGAKPSANGGREKSSRSGAILNTSEATSRLRDGSSAPRATSASSPTRHLVQDNSAMNVDTEQPAHAARMSRRIVKGRHTAIPSANAGSSRAAGEQQSPDPPDGAWQVYLHNQAETRKFLKQFGKIKKRTDLETDPNKQQNEQTGTEA